MFLSGYLTVNSTNMKEDDFMKKLLLAVLVCLLTTTTPQQAYAQYNQDPGFAIGQALGSMWGAKASSVHSKHDDNINKEYDFSKVKNILVFSFGDQNPNNIYDDSACVAAGHWFKEILNERLEENCPTVLIFGSDVIEIIKEEHTKYVDAGGTLSEQEFGAVLMRNFSDLMIAFKTEINGRDRDRAWCNMNITATDAKSGENVFTRTEQRVHINLPTKIYTEKDVTLKTVEDYTKKFAKLLKKSQDSQEDETDN